MAKNTTIRKGCILAVFDKKVENSPCLVYEIKYSPQSKKPGKKPGFFY